MRRSRYARRLWDCVRFVCLEFERMRIQLKARHSHGRWEFFRCSGALRGCRNGNDGCSKWGNLYLDNA